MDLKRELNLLDIFCMTVGAVISAELFILPGIAYAKAGPSVILSFLIAGIIALPAMLSASELVSAMPKTGGIYYYASKSMGYTIGTIAGFTRWFAISLKSAFAIIGVGAYIALITGIPIVLIAAGFCIFFTFINLIGIKPTGKIQLFVVFGLLGILSLYVIYGLSAVELDKYRPFIPFGIGSTLSTAGFLFISYGALLGATSFAEEVQRPERTIPRGMFFSLVVVGALYALVVFVTVGVLDAPKLQNSLIPVSEGAGVFMGTWGSLALALAALFASISTANSGITTASRYQMAMSRDKILPHCFQRVNHRFRTPHISILFTGWFMLLVVVLLNLELVVKVASTLLIMSYIFPHLAVMIMRKSKVHDYQPKFFAPLFPWTQIFGTIGLVILIVEMGMIPIMASALFIVAALAWYCFYASSRVNRA